MHDISFIGGYDLISCLGFALGLFFGATDVVKWAESKTNTDKIYYGIFAVLQFTIAMWCVTVIIRGVV